MAVSGAIAERDKYSDLFLQITQTSGLLTPIVSVIYGVAVMLHIAPPGPAYSFIASLIIFPCFIVLGIVQFVTKPSKPLSLGIFVGLYHVFAVLYLVFGPGVIGPIVYCWIVLALITDIFFGHRSTKLSLCLVTCTFLVLYLLEPVHTMLLDLNYTIYLLVIVVGSILTILLRSVQTIEHQDLKRSRQQEKLQRGQFTTLINSLSAAIFSTSSTGTVRIYNAALLNLLDTNQSLSGKNIDNVLNLYDSNGEPVSLIDIMHKANHAVERDDLVHRFDDGEMVSLGISSSPIRGHFSGSESATHHEGYIFIVRDITAAKSLEEERDEFISVVSHELRTPITIAEGTLSNLQFLLDRHQNPKQFSPALKDAHEQIVYLASMVNDLSTLSRAERGVADAPEEIDVRQLLEELYHRYQPKAAEKGLELNLDAGHKLGTISASRLYLEEILQNFITNSIKYTPKGSVTVKAHRNSDGIEFAISDTGIGISKTEQKHIFEKFYRSEDYRTRETSGTGLGLYVVKKLSVKLGIEVNFESRLNHGSTFSFTLYDASKAPTPKQPLDEKGPAGIHLT